MDWSLHYDEQDASVVQENLGDSSLFSDLMVDFGNTSGGLSTSSFPSDSILELNSPGMEIFSNNEELLSPKRNSKVLPQFSGPTQIKSSKVSNTTASKREAKGVLDCICNQPQLDRLEITYKLIILPIYTCTLFILIYFVGLYWCAINATNGSTASVWELARSWEKRCHERDTSGCVLFVMRPRVRLISKIFNPWSEYFFNTIVFVFRPQSKQTEFRSHIATRSQNKLEHKIPILKISKKSQPTKEGN